MAFHDIRPEDRVEGGRWGASFLLSSKGSTRAQRKSTVA